MALIATSQPVSPIDKKAGNSQRHSLIASSVDITQVQEFKDAGTIHLNQMQKLMMSSVGKAFPTKTYIITKIDFLNMWNDRCYILGAADSSVVGGSPRPNTAAELAVLSYIFDQGIDHFAKGSGAKGTATPTGITGSISPKDLGMTPQQLKQSVTQYVENHQSRFWNEARVGLASNR